MTNMREGSGAVEISRVIECDPDKLIEIGHRLKQAAFDMALPGESVLIQLTHGIKLCYNPEKEFVKPVHKVGGSILTSVQTPDQ